MSLFDSPHETPDQRPDRKGGRLVFVVILVLALLVGGGWAAAYYGAGDKTPRGAKVEGVEIGGRSQAKAIQALQEGLADRESEPITVTVNGKQREVDPADAGLSVDYEASVAEVGGEKSWSPTKLWNYYTGGDDADAVIDVDEAKMADTVAKLGKGLGKKPQDGSFTFKASGVTEKDPVVGEGIEPEATEAALIDAYLSDDPVADLEVTEVAPEIDEDVMREARDTFVNPARSGPVTLAFGKSKVKLQPRDYLASLSLKAEDGTLVPQVDQQRVKQMIDNVTSDKGKPVDATVALKNGKPRVVPAKPGVTFDPKQVSDTLLELVATDADNREAKVESTVAEPEFTTEDAKNLKIRRQVSKAVTYFPYAEYRNTNIGRAADLINGTVLKPGETFSLNDIVGERTAENGFVPGTIISDGIFREDFGGGVSQMATTTFNAAFFAGLKDIEHKPHSFYIDRYPVGREATVAWPTVDLRFQNDTDYGVLIEAYVQDSTPSSQGVVTVKMWSTKTWDITSKTSERYAYVSPGTRTLTTSDCMPNSGYSGFQVDVWRYFHKPGESAVEKEEKFHTVYTPSDTVICKPPAGNGN